MAATSDSSAVARVTSEAFLERYGQDAGQRLEDIARELGLRVVEVDARGFEGALLRVRGAQVGTIAIRSSIRESGRKRFTLAHELGHYVLPTQQHELSPCQSREIESWSDKLKRQETEANTFAAEVLVPRALITPRELKGVGLDAARQVAERFRVSLTAAALRLVETTSEPLAVVMSTKGQVEWSQRSTEFKHWVKKEVLDPRTLAYDHFQGKRTAETDRIKAEAWIEGKNLLPSATIVEWSVAMPAYESVLTVLHLPEPVEPQDDDDETPLDPDDFSLGRRRWPR